MEKKIGIRVETELSLSADCIPFICSEWKVCSSRQMIGPAADDLNFLLLFAFIHLSEKFTENH